MLVNFLKKDQCEVDEIIPIQEKKNWFNELSKEIVELIFSNPSLTSGELVCLRGGKFSNKITQYYSNLRLVNKKFSILAVSSLPFFINNFSLPLSNVFNLNAEKDVLVFVKRYGKHLTYLNLSQFTNIKQEALQEILNQCPHLTKLRVDNKNKLKLNYSHLNKLESLMLFVNSIQESTFGKFPALRTLCLSCNDSRLQHLDKFENITELQLNGCQNLSDISNINLLSNLKIVKIQSCGKLLDRSPLNKLPLR